MKGVFVIGQTISHYKILEKLGEGGMGVVYKAEDTKLRRKVALKFLPPEMTKDPEAKERFIVEAQAASSLDHANICTVHEIEEADDGRTFIVMSHYDGETLKEKVSRGPLKIEESLNIAIQVAEGLKEAHEKTIVHRDIKPDNVMITSRAQVKIMDFGLAKLSGMVRLTKETSTIGTAAYMSPEQSKGKEVDQRTDIWSLGVLLYEMITGRLPFKGEYDQSVMYAIMNEEPDPITGLRTGVPVELERIVAKALKKNPDERYQNVSDLIVDLRAVQGRLTTGKEEFKPEGKQRPKKWLHITAAALLLVIAVTAVLRMLRPTGPDRIDSIAVLPLENLSDDPEQEYFTDGMTDALIGKLAQISALRVISRTSVMKYKETRKSIPEIARELDVDALIEGTVLQSEDQVRITVQLLGARPERHLWASDYVRDLSDVIVLQEEVSRSIAGEINVTVTQEEQARLSAARPVDPEVYGLYLKGRFYWNLRTHESLERSMMYFQEALKIDPNYALAHIGMADCFLIMGFYAALSPEEAFPTAKAFVEKALKLDDTLAEAYNSLAYIKMLYDWDWDGAEADFKKAIELNPNYSVAHQWYGEYLSLMGRQDEALIEGTIAVDLDPFSSIAKTNRASFYMFTGDVEQAIEVYEEVIESDPDFMVAHFFSTYCYSLLGRHEEAITEARLVRGKFENIGPGKSLPLGFAYAKAGKNEEAREILDSLLTHQDEGYLAPVGVATIYAALGEMDTAFEWLDKAIEVRDHWLVQLKVNRIYKNLRSDPRFPGLLQQIGFEPY
jgi:serine/threonine protein kinase/tetratricopeptide (TPR) repeat protein